MPRFYIIERQACKVTWRFPVEAENESEAFAKYGNGDHGEAVGGAEIGDSIDSFQYDLDIESAPAIPAAPDLAEQARSWRVELGPQDSYPGIVDGNGKQVLAVLVDHAAAEPSEAECEKADAIAAFVADACRAHAAKLTAKPSPAAADSE